MTVFTSLSNYPEIWLSDWGPVPTDPDNWSSVEPQSLREAALSMFDQRTVPHLTPSVLHLAVKSGTVQVHM